MTPEAFAAFRKSVEDTFQSLYTIDVGSLSPEDRQRHQRLLSAAYLAVLAFENKAFGDLTASAKARLPDLAQRARALQDQLSGLKHASETLELVSSSLSVLTAIVKVLS